MIYFQLKVVEVLEYVKSLIDIRENECEDVIRQKLQQCVIRMFKIFYGFIIFLCSKGHSIVIFHQPVDNVKI